MIAKNNLTIFKRFFISWETIFDEPKLVHEIQKTEKEINEDSFWDNNKDAQTIFNSLSEKKKKLETITSIRTIEGDILAYYDLINTDPSLASDSELQTDYEKNIKIFVNQVADLENKSLLSGPYDTYNAYINFNAGAGGTDAQDWTEMLLRMYLRWCEKRQFKVDVLDKTSGDEAGIKSATCLVSGDLVYGYLKYEQGIHRLVRQSPFNANSKRQTSFAGIEVIPQIDTTVSTVTIDPKDLKVDTYRASGAGGQHVNKTDSAVRITHIPTGVVATSQASRSQASNKETALALLKSRLLIIMQEEKKQEVSQLKGEQKENAWGNQIRSYVLHPYKLVKDLRSNYETSDVQGVLDGDLDKFVESLLRIKKEDKA
ncbi:MAG: peptide chain release factor 2 [Rickettsiales bacterium]|nr:peptide chain release factor 2 [Rickettsiales bacterium]|tara:strand:+ start:42529 stop:43644 length:1116 start_codon:yes stop_codon:yes gene_type:complete